MENASNLNFHLLFTLLLLASGVAIVTKWIRLPYSIALVMVGLLIGIFHWLPVVNMTPELILLIFLPAMLFEASWNLQIEWLKTSIRPISILATIGVFVSTLIVGLVLHHIAGLDLKVALLFGAMLSATDPISVLSLFKRLNVNKRLHTILEGESLLNDGTAVALFRVLLTAILLGGDLSVAKICSEFLVMTIGGSLVGLAVGFLASKLTQYFDDHLLETTLTVLVAYGSYMLAEQAKVSPVIAVLVAGFIMGNFGSRRSMSATTRLAVDSFWEYAAFIAESLVFLLIGMQIRFDLVVKYSPFIGCGIVAILLARMVVVYFLCLIFRDKKFPIPLNWQHLLFWGGLRGSLCMAMALSLPESFPQRELLIVTTFGVALFTLLVPGLTMEALVKLMKVSGQQTSRFGQLQIELTKLQREKTKLNKALHAGQLNRKVHKEKMQSLELKINETIDLIQLLEHSNDTEDEVERLFIETALTRAQRECLLQLGKKQGASSAILAEYRDRVDGQYMTMKLEQSSRNEEIDK